MKNIRHSVCSSQSSVVRGERYRHCTEEENGSGTALKEGALGHQRHSESHESLKRDADNINVIQIRNVSRQMFYI